MSTPKETIEKAYGNIPKEISSPFGYLDWVPSPRGLKYYYLKLKRLLTR